MREADVPADLAPAGNALPDAIGEAMGLPDAVPTRSRSDWLHSTLLKVFNGLGGSALAFLVKDPESLPNIDPAAFRSIPGAGFIARKSG